MSIKAPGSALVLRLEAQIQGQVILALLRCFDWDEWALLPVVPSFVECGDLIRKLVVLAMADLMFHHPRRRRRSAQ